MIAIVGDHPDVTQTSFAHNDDSHFKQSLAKLENDKKMMQKNLKQM
jgi:hypothetical protein